jgi:glyoxylase-like metal-dependent hydrolase (beta-lactamase superfamily II)
MAAPILQRVSGDVLRMGTRFVNWYLVADDDGVTVVDAAVPKYVDQLDAGLRELGRTRSDLKAVVLTHAHADHVGFAERLRTELGIPVRVHAEDEQLATAAKSFGKNDGSMFPYLRYPMAYRLLFELARGGGARPQRIGEVQTFRDGDELDVPGRLRAIHTPGNTAGHTSFVTGDVLIAGDALCTLNPLTGSRGPQLMPSAFNRSTPQAGESLSRLVGTGARVLVPGHGDPVEAPDSAAREAQQRGPT